MIINDPVFGELSYFLVWSKHMTIHFCGKETEIALTVEGEEDGKFDEEQYNGLSITHAKLGAHTTACFASDPRLLQAKAA